MTEMQFWVLIGLVAWIAWSVSEISDDFRKVRFALERIAK